MAPYWQQNQFSASKSYNNPYSLWRVESIMISLLFGIKDQISKKSLGYINKLHQRIVLQRTGRFACTHFSTN